MTIGRHITPTLKLVREIGKGGMGRVWAAENLSLGSPVAIKMMFPGYADDEKSTTRFKQEAQRAARVRNPHVATIFDHGVTAEGEPFIVMEWLEGETLAQRIQRNGPLPVDEIELLVGQTAKALAAAHRLGVVHRDVKPANLFIVDNGGEPFVKVVDFGIAKQMDAETDTTTNTFLGSPAYMSPEQYINPKQVDFRTDLWSLGVVAYEALTGVQPFSAETRIALALAITNGRFILPTELQRDLPWMIDHWISRALGVDPEKRFGSATEMAESLIFALESRPKSQKMPVNDPLAFAATAQTPRPPSVRPHENVQTRIEQAPPARKSQPPPSILAYARFFEGAWRSSPSGGHYYIRFIRGKLRVAYCFSGNHELSGEYYDCLVAENSLFARFRWPTVPSLRGYIAMHGGSDNELVGGWWRESDVPARLTADLSKLNKSIPNMHPALWRRIRPTPLFPDWAESYFASIERSSLSPP
ncbi:MAG TPA: serine/threonine-protein kinase [Polyangium sp.]|nr:serine/threonine-protein kinase [Polyangium sp.]